MTLSPKARVLAVSVAVLLFVLLLFVPRTPAVDSGEAPSTVREIDQEVSDAQALMESENPMAGILKLREILDRDPGNVDALWVMGTASMRTGQYEKAITRFQDVLKHDEEGKYFEASLFLGQAYEQTGQVKEAIESYKRFLESENEPQLMQDVRERIAALETKS